MQNKIPEPTIGRVVYFWCRPDPKEQAAIVADVVDGYTVNLNVINHDGSCGSATSVPHITQAGSSPGWWDWMPFQKGQAAKTEQLQAELDKKLAK